MKRTREITAVRSILVLWAFLVLGMARPLDHVRAQEKMYVIGHKDIFGKLQRPPVKFPHEAHMETLEERGCGACHHLYNEDEGTLYYEEGEELSCTDCHGIKDKRSNPSLMYAYHGKCTRCHRLMIKRRKESGPTTCGGCHTRH